MYLTVDVFINIVALTLCCVTLLDIVRLSFSVVIMILYHARPLLVK